MKPKFSIALTGVCLLGVCLLAGCQCQNYFAHMFGCHDEHVASRPTHEFSHYSAEETVDFQWNKVRRVVVVPFANQSQYPNSSASIKQAIAAELQSLGNFEVVVAPESDVGPRAANVLSSGKFDELEVLDYAREFNADAVLFGMVTHFQPYEPIHVGLSMIMVYPAESIIVAAVDGLWDTREQATADEAREYYQRRIDHTDSLSRVERVTESSAVFQRFVASQIAAALGPRPPVPVQELPGQGLPGHNEFPQTAEVLPETGYVGRSGD